MASPAPRGTEKVDIVVSDKDGKSSFRIQVKTTEGTVKNGWFLSKKHETQSEKDLFFCLVALHEISPEIYVVPSSVIARVIAADHQQWLSKISKSGVTRKYTDMRKVKASMPLQPNDWLETYKENWTVFL